MEIDSENKENIENMLNKYYEDFLSLIKQNSLNLVKI